METLPLVLVGSHIGYPMDRTPLGGGGMVGAELARRWARDPGVSITVFGPGPVPPFENGPGARYLRVLPEQGVEPVRMSEFQYAGFSRRFERAATDRIRTVPEPSVVVVNDISESPDLGKVRGRGHRVASIWHVDVVEFFSKLYLRGWVSPERAAGLYEGICRRGWNRWVPDLLRLVYESGLNLLRYELIQASLEDVFMELLGEENK